jgi:phycocyanobilin:ferredoxin oxidoreductase
MKTCQTSIRERQHSLICKLANVIESTWQQNLKLSPYQIPPDLGFIENQLEGETLVIENTCYQAPQFRKLHLELAQIGNGLDILHCVMFPRAEYALPIFGTDIVGARGQISAAIVDLSPVQMDGRLPYTYQLALSQLPDYGFSQPRELPAWGDIFSMHCTFIRPVDSAEEAGFLQRVRQMIEIHCTIASQTSPVRSAIERKAILAGQEHYCRRQRENDKTRRVLEKSFGPDWTERYMNTMLFDSAPAENICGSLPNNLQN